MAAAVLLLAGCAGDSSTSKAAHGCVSATELIRSQGAAGGRPTLTITARDDHFDPACVDAAPEGEITLVVRNGGHHPHNLTLASGDSVSVDRAQVAFITAQVARDGLAYVCTIHPGMEGRIRVA